MPETNPNVAAETPAEQAAQIPADAVAATTPVGCDAVRSTDDQPTVISKATSHPVAFALGEQFQGRQLAHFELLEAVGVGGMAAVLKARDLQLDRCVALKILPPEMAKDPEAVRRFNQEARAAAKLDHENIARVFYCGLDQSLHFIAFEYVEGDNLRNIIDRRHRLPVREAVHYMLQVAAGLAHAAARGVVHRDIKPSNIIITPTGRAKLVDMGLARHLEQPFDKGLTHSGITLGTFDYISPEQAEEPRNADVRSDIYSLGCTFYHALTGQPPVPEGTAAKKLKHHQAVAPIDPRQLNPEIPDDVTAILARMMAKDPKDRYQRAEQLVQHLIIAAQRLGASASLPEGPLYVDAALPQPPRARPLLVGGIAAAALVIFVVVIGQLTRTTPALSLGARGSGDGRDPTASIEPVSSAAQGSRASLEPSSKSDGVPPKTALTYDKEPSTRGVLAFLHEAKTDADLVIDLPGGDIDLNDSPSDAGPAPLVFQGRKLTVQSHSSASPLTIRMTDNGRGAGAKLLAALEVDCDELVLKNIRFIVMSDSSKAPLACVLARCRKKCQVEQCQFVLAQSAGQGEKTPSAAIVIDNSNDGSRPTVSVGYCTFIAADSYQSGTAADDTAINGADRCASDAILIRSSCSIDVSHCAFGPHNALFHAGGHFPAPLDLKWLNCTGLLAEGSVFLIEDGIAAKMSVKHCLFGRAGSDFSENDDRQLVLLKQKDEPGDISFKGEGNGYYHLDASWLRQGERITSLLETDASAVLRKIPWKNDSPLKFLERFRLHEAFQLDEQRAELRQKDAPLTLVGVDHVPGGSSYNAGLVAKVDKKPARIVDPNVKESGGGVYPSLVTALREARPGEQIKIRHTKKSNVLRESLIALDRADLDVVILPDEGADPVLTLAEGSLDSESTLFRVQKGKIQFERIEFVLQPQTDGSTASQALFAIFGDCQVTFKNCTFTLDGSQRQIPMSILRLDDPPKDAKPPIRADRHPTVRFEDCLIRAEGDLVKARGGQPLDLSISNSLVAVTGSLLNLESTPQVLATVRLKMDKVTACLVTNLLHLQQQGKEVRSTVPLQADSINDCLFISPRGSPLIHLDGVAAGDDRMRKLFTWEGKNNAYVNFTRMLNQSTNDDAMAMLFCDAKDWKEVYEPGAKFLKAGADILARLLPMQIKFHPESEWQGFGITDMDALPRPHWPVDKGIREED